MRAINYLKGLGAVTVLFANFGCASTPQMPEHSSSPLEPTITRAPQSLTVEAGQYTVLFSCVNGGKIKAGLFKGNQPVESKVYDISNFEEKLKRDTRNLRYLGYWRKAENRGILVVGNKAATLCNG